MKTKIAASPIFFILLGLMFLIFPMYSEKLMVIMIGLTVLIPGLVIMFSVLKDREKNFAFGPKAFIAFMLTIVGLLLVFAPQTFIAYVWIIAGLIIASDGLYNLLYLKFANNRLLSMGLSVLSLILGIFIITHPFGTGAAFIRIVGIFFLYEGIGSYIARHRGTNFKDEKSKVITAEHSIEKSEVENDE